MRQRRKQGPVTALPCFFPPPRGSLAPTLGTGADLQGGRGPGEGEGAPWKFAGAPPLGMDLMSSVSK